MKALIDFIAQALVDRPEAVQVTETSTNDGVVLELRVAPEDLGRVIGRKGATVKAMRQLLTAAAAKAKIKVSLAVQE